jgi:hypothetical protein
MHEKFPADSDLKFFIAIMIVIEISIRINQTLKKKYPGPAEYRA